MDIRMQVEQLMASELGPFVPRLMAAAGIVLVAWVLSRLVRATVSRLAQRTGLERRLQTPGLAAVLTQVATGLVWLLALPALLGTLQLQALLDPVNVMMSRLMGFVPNLFGAVVILGVGLLAARILRQIVEGLLIAAGSENLAERLGLGTALGERKLASLAGSALFLLIMLPTLTAALQALGLEAVARPVGQMLDAVVALVPRLVSAGLIVAIGALLGRVVAGVIVAALVGVGVNRWPARMGLPDGWRFAGRDLAELAGSLVMLGFVMAAITQACQVLGFEVLTDVVTVLGSVMARLVTAALVMAIGLWLAAAAAQAIESSGRHEALAWARVARGAILFFSTALALRQSGLPGDIIVIAFAAVVGAIALGLALALGLGGREVAARLLEALARRYTRIDDERANPPA
jgi:hypothetical protein